MRLLVSCLVLLCASPLWAAQRVLLAFEADGQHRVVRVMTVAESPQGYIPDDVHSQSPAAGQLRVRWFDADRVVGGVLWLPDPRLTHAPPATREASLEINAAVHTKGAYLLTVPDAARRLELDFAPHEHALLPALSLDLELVPGRTIPRLRPALRELPITNR